MQNLHEHIIRMSEKNSEVSEKICREDLWKGLLYFVTHPEVFISTLEEADIEENRNADGHSSWSRTLNFGAFSVSDFVTAEPEKTVTFTIPETENIPASQLEIRIEEPETGSLFLRFTYHENTDHAALKEAEKYKPLRIQAWESKDKDVCQKLLQLIAEGKFKNSVH